ncbi:MAG: DUF2157 domain-containing protein [Actinomycetota bacterium]
MRAALGLLIPILLLVGLFVWFRRSQGEKPSVGPRQGRISLLTEAVGYVGAILVLAGAGVAIAQRWEDLTDGARLGLVAGLTLFFLGVGYFTRRSTEPAYIRLTSVVWLIGTAGIAATLAQFFTQMVETSDETSFLALGRVVERAVGREADPHLVGAHHHVEAADGDPGGDRVRRRVDPDQVASVLGVLAVEPPAAEDPYGSRSQKDFILVPGHRGAERDLGHDLVRGRIDAHEVPGPLAALLGGLGDRHRPDRGRVRRDCGDRPAL